MVSGKDRLSVSSGCGHLGIGGNISGAATMIHMWTCVQITRMHAIAIQTERQATGKTHNSLNQEMYLTAHCSPVFIEQVNTNTTVPKRKTGRPKIDLLLAITTFKMI